MSEGSFTREDIGCFKSAIIEKKGNITRTRIYCLDSFCSDDCVERWEQDSGIDEAEREML